VSISSAYKFSNPAPGKAVYGSQPDVSCHPRQGGDRAGRWLTCWEQQSRADRGQLMEEQLAG